MSTNKSKKKVTEVEKEDVKIEDIQVTEHVEIQNEDGIPDSMPMPALPPLETETKQPPLVAAKYVANELAIDRYLASAKPFEKIRQTTKGGRFVDSKGNIYIPLSLIKIK